MSDPVPAFTAGFGVAPGSVPKAICGTSDGAGVAAAIRSELGAGGGAVSALVSLPTNGVSSARWVPANGPSDDAAAFASGDPNADSAPTDASAATAAVGPGAPLLPGFWRYGT